MPDLEAMQPVSELHRIVKHSSDERIHTRGQRTVRLTVYRPAVTIRHIYNVLREHVNPPAHASCLGNTSGEQEGWGSMGTLF